MSAADRRRHTRAQVVRIAISGPAGIGKSAVARVIAKELQAQGLDVEVNDWEQEIPDAETVATRLRGMKHAAIGVKIQTRTR